MEKKKHLKEDIYKFILIRMILCHLCMVIIFSKNKNVLYFLTISLYVTLESKEFTIAIRGTKLSGLISE